MEAIVRMPYEAAVRAALAALERNILPDALVRRLTRLLLAGRLRLGYQPSAELQLAELVRFKQGKAQTHACCWPNHFISF